MAGRGELPASGFGAAMLRLRQEKGWTQKQLADATGLHPNTVARLERGEHEPTWPLVLKLAKALGVDCTAFAAADPESGPAKESGLTAGEKVTEPKYRAPKRKPKGK